MNLASYTKCLKIHALNMVISDEDFFNALLKPVIVSGKICNKNGDLLCLNKSRTSLILSGKEDVPIALREAIGKRSIYKDIVRRFQDFIDYYLNENELSEAVLEVSTMIEEERNIANKATLMSKIEEPATFLAYALIEAIKLKNDGYSPEGEIIRNGAYYVKVIYSDIFKFAFRKKNKKKNIIVVPIDSKFHTHVTKKYENNPVQEVSENTIHGQWLLRWEQSGENISELSARIRNNIYYPFAIEVQGEEFPIGTISVVEHSNTVFYLLVISKFDSNNNAQSSIEDIRTAIDSLFRFYDSNGQGYDVFIPLMGTGKSRANMALQESYDVLVECLQNNKNLIHGNIHIVIQKDFENQVVIRNGGN